LIYRLAPIVFVGGSLASHGGQNPVEPIKLGAAVLHGPNVWNFVEIYEALDAARGAEQISDVGKLTVRVGALLTDAAERTVMTSAALTIVERLGGALDRTVAALDPYLMQIRLERRSSHA
jgi:3-deoxy-D-manno-octulosonic-acid transferase